MTREEQINGAVETYMNGLVEDGIEIPIEDYENIEEGFIAGTKWADEHPKNVWRDASEEPKHGEDIIALCDGVPVAGAFTKHLLGKGIFRYHCLLCDWYSPQKWETVDKWAYIKDLLPKTK